MKNNMKNYHNMILHNMKNKDIMTTSKELKADKDFVLKAVKRDGCALRYASEALKADKNVVLEAVKQKGNALMYASEAL